MQYEVLRDTDSDVNGAARLNGYGAAITSYTDTNVQAGTTYYYWIKVTDTSNSLSYSQGIAGKLTTTAASQTSTSASAIISGSNYKVSSKLSGKSLDVVASSSTPGAQIQQYDYNGNNNQKWGVSAENGNFMIYALNSYQCLDIPNGTGNSGTYVQQYTCSHQANQNWRLLSNNGFYQIQNVASGKCLEVQNYSTGNGTRIVQSDCNGADNKLWRFDKI